MANFKLLHDSRPKFSMWNMFGAMICIHQFYPAREEMKKKASKHMENYTI